MSLINSVPTTMLDKDIISGAIDFLNTGVFNRINAHTENKEKARRKTWEYGYAFHDLIKGKHHFKGVPRQLLDVYERAATQLTEISHEKLPQRTEIKNCIISSYGETDFLGAHCDEDLERSLLGRGRNSFYFGEKIIGVILLADSKGGLYLLDAQSHHDTKDRSEQFHLNEVDGLAFLLSGVNRRRFHGVSPIASKRISLTFRTVHICP